MDQNSTLREDLIWLDFEHSIERNLNVGGAVLNYMRKVLNYIHSADPLLPNPGPNFLLPPNRSLQLQPLERRLRRCISPCSLDLIHDNGPLLHRVDNFDCLKVPKSA